MEQILVEWTVADPGADLARWQAGIRRYEAGSLDDSAEMGEAADLMCAALTHYVANGSAIMGSSGESPETTIAQTVWNVLVATVHGSDGNNLSADSNRRLRLALAAARLARYQPGDLGGSGLMAEIFDEDSRSLMAVALSDPATDASTAPVDLTAWFTGSGTAKPALAMPGAGTPGSNSTTPPATPPAQARPAVPAGSKWTTLKKRAQQAKQHVNPLALQHGIESLHGALTEAQVAKVDKSTGKLKVRKFGVAKAAFRPANTLRRAIDGAAVTEHLKAYNESYQMSGRRGSNASAGGPIVASSAEEFASYASKRDYLRDWARRLVVSAGVPPTERLIVEHASMAATATGLMVFLRLGARHGISDLRQYFSDGEMPPGTPLDTYDELYRKVVEAEPSRHVVDEGITAFLNSCWADWVEGIRSDNRPLLPADIAAQMAEYGRARWNQQFEISEPGPFDGALQDMPPDAQRAWVTALSDAVVPVGGWAVMGAQVTVMKVAGRLADLPAYRAIMDAALEFQRSAGVWEFQLSITEKAYWHEHHQNELWLARRDPPSRAAAVIPPLPVGQERKLAIMSNVPDSNEVYASQPEAGRYVAIVEAPLERGSASRRVRREADTADSLYDLYCQLGEAMKLPNHWVDPELEPFFPYPSPRI